MFPDVVMARELRAAMIANPEEYRYPKITICPICGRDTSSHNSEYRTSAGWNLSLPCFSRNEWDRYGLHIRPNHFVEKVVL